MRDRRPMSTTSAMHLSASRTSAIVRHPSLRRKTAVSVCGAFAFAVEGPHSKTATRRVYWSLYSTCAALTLRSGTQSGVRAGLKEDQSGPQAHCGRKGAEKGGARR